MILFHEPMLAASLMPSNLEHTDTNIYHQMMKMYYDVIATLKKDGIRAVRIDKTLKSRTRKLIPNLRIRERAESLPAGFDMELWHPDMDYNDIESIVMSEEHEKSELIQFHLIDWFGKDGDYSKRMAELMLWQSTTGGRGDVIMPELHQCRNADELMTLFLSIEKEEGEGICFRLPAGGYKQGRSTLKEQLLVKLSRYIYEEAVITGFEEQMVNCNPDKYNALGKMKRSTCEANMFGKDTLGALICQLKTGVTVRVATGFKDNLRRHLWLCQKDYLGKMITIKHKPHGALLRPRSPIFVGFRKEGF